MLQAQHRWCYDIMEISYQETFEKWLPCEAKFPSPYVL